MTAPPVSADPATAPNLYLPDLMEVLEVQQHTADTKSVRLRFRNEIAARRFSFRVGQFGIFSAFGSGEATFNLCSSSTWKDYIEFCFRRTGMVTDALWEVDKDDTIGFRGPYGNGYPMEKWRRKHLIFLGGGIAMPPIRCAIWYALEHRDEYGEITIIYGARSTKDLVFADDLARWAQYDGVQVIRCVDPGGETPDWDGEVGFVPEVLKRADVRSDNSVALVVGPPIMIKLTMPLLTRMGLVDRDIYTSLESRMKCGVGKCGRCNCGPVYLCKEGPVFTLEQLKALPNDY